MKKKIAVFTNGWNDDYLDFALEGIRRRAAEDNRWWGSYGLSRVLPEDRDSSLPNPFPSEGH